ncbi:MAG: formylglycine-generating enzyme family protein [Planctomycetes bacterium]|nr:formylglycine-generating enzyme family protein [Planctomycetota bacterium]
MPNAGFPWTLTVTNLRSNTAGYVIFAFRDDYLGVNLLPMDLAFLGAPSCYVNVNSDPATGAVVELLPSGAQGLAALTLGIPIDPTVMGFTFYNQYVSLDAPSGRSLLITTTNAGRGLVGPVGGPNMVLISAGSFRMGSTIVGETAVPVHTVHITSPFWIGKHEVTQAEYQALMGTNPSQFPGPDQPVETVSWHDAMAYCATLTAREALAGRLPTSYQYRLPTEAEWEYCCRAGTTTEYWAGNALTCTDANFCAAPSPTGCCVGRITDVGTYAANAWGLHDTHGNVWEWCLDSWDGSSNYPANTVSDPYVSSGYLRVQRGGCFACDALRCRSAARVGGSPGRSHSSCGFRVALAPILVP